MECTCTRRKRTGNRVTANHGITIENNEATLLGDTAGNSNSGFLFR